VSFADAFAAYTGSQAALEAARQAQAQAAAQAAADAAARAIAVAAAPVVAAAVAELPTSYFTGFTDDNDSGVSSTADGGGSGWGPNSIPQFASGTEYFGGGARIVGERGPELEVTGPSRIFNASQTRDILRGGANATDATADEVRRLSAQVAQLIEVARASAGHAFRAAKVLDQLHVRGVQLRDRDDQTYPTVKVAA
jgi:hypothetical protein